MCHSRHSPAKRTEICPTCLITWCVNCVIHQWKLVVCACVIFSYRVFPIWHCFLQIRPTCLISPRVIRLALLVRACVTYSNRVTLFPAYPPVLSDKSTCDIRMNTLSVIHVWHIPTKTVSHFTLFPADPPVLSDKSSSQDHHLFLQSVSQRDAFVKEIGSVNLWTCTIPLSGIEYGWCANSVCISLQWLGNIWC